MLNADIETKACSLKFEKNMSWRAHKTWYITKKSRYEHRIAHLFYENFL